MCGRYASTKNPATLAVEFDAIDGTGDGTVGTGGGGTGGGAGPPEPDYNVAPTKPVFSVVNRHPRDAEGTPDPARTERSIRVMRWGLVPHWAKDPGIGSRLINARAETAATKPAFRDALTRRRCLLPADGWYEWQASSASSARAASGTRKQPFFITPADGSGLAMAGVWSTWRAADAEPGAPLLVTCAVLTTAAVGPLAEIHHRMPLILPAQAWAGWLDPDVEDPGSLLAAPSAELVHTLELRPVSTAVNNVRHQGPELVKRIEPEQPALLDLDRIQ